MNLNANSLNTIRLIAAFQVLYGHVMAHLHLAAIPIAGTILDFFQGVPIFFTMSGFLIWFSVDRSRNYKEFLKKRFWRIYPELFVAVLIELIVILILYNEPINWLQFTLFGLTQSTFFQFWTPDCLRGYGCGTPNGALWTICVIIQFYLIAFPIYKFVHNNLFRWGVVIVVSFILGLVSPLFNSNIPENSIILLDNFPLIPSLVADNKNVLLPFLKKYWWAFLVFLFLANIYTIDIEVGKYFFVSTICLFFGLTGFAYAVPHLNIRIDISYAVYIYHMTIVNALIAVGFTNNNWGYVVVISLTCIVSWISTVTIGNWAKTCKNI